MKEVKPTHAHVTLGTKYGRELECKLILGNFLGFLFGPDKFGIRGSLVLQVFKARRYILSYYKLCFRILKLIDRLVVMIEQGGVAKATFNTSDGMTDSITNIAVLLCFKLDTCTKIAEE